MLTNQDVFTFLNRNDLTIIDFDRRGPKILETSDGEIIKLFRKKSWFSSDQYRPYAIRFCKNAQRLRRLGLIAPEVSSLHYCRKFKTYFVHYKKLIGEEIASIVKKGNYSILYELSAFVSLLHQKGIFFRAVNLSNFLFQKENLFALIDVADMQFKNNPLSFDLRFRNLNHLFSCTKDQHLWQTIDIKVWLASYNQQAQLMTKEAEKLLAKLQNIIK